LTDSIAEHQIRVLVVDDEPLVRNFLRKLLEKQRKYHVLTAGSGEEALRLSRQSADTIDVLITDFEMGDMNGIQLYTQLAMERPRTAVLFVSADADVVRGSHPDWPFLKKPFVPRDFVTKLQEVHSTPDAERP
jgi:CheY-like chemotaxis protein